MSLESDPPTLEKSLESAGNTEKKLATALAYALSKLVEARQSTGSEYADAQAIVNFFGDTFIDGAMRAWRTEPGFTRVILGELVQEVDCDKGRRLEQRARVQALFRGMLQKENSVILESYAEDFDLGERLSWIRARFDLLQQCTDDREGDSDEAAREID